MVHRRSYPNLRMFLRKTKTSQRVFAQRVGIDPSYVTHILSGAKTPGLQVAARIAKEANIPIESILDLAS